MKVIFFLCFISFGTISAAQPLTISEIAFDISQSDYCKIVFTNGKSIIAYKTVYRNGKILVRIGTGAGIVAYRIDMIAKIINLKKNPKNNKLEEVKRTEEQEKARKKFIHPDDKPLAKDYLPF